MKNLTLLRPLITITFCIITIIITGCEAMMTCQQIDPELLEQNKNKTFKVGIIQATGIPNQFSNIKEALDNIPVSAIWSELSSRYSITIDANVDKSVRFSRGEIVESEWQFDRNHPGDYSKARLKSKTRALLNAYYGNPINTPQFSDVVNVSYTIYGEPTYDINIISSKQQIFCLQGNSDKAGRVHEALKRDLLKKDLFDESIRNEHPNDALKKEPLQA